MKKYIFLTVILAIFCQTIFAQRVALDSIFTSDGIVLANVKKISPDVIEYSFPDEEMVMAIYKNTVKKIHFKSGRVQVFTRTNTLNPVNNALDFESVTLTHLEGETKGMIKIDEVVANIIGSTGFSNTNTVKERALRKIKIASAMLGGNLLYMVDQSIVNNQFQIARATEAILTGLVYTDNLPKMEDFKTLIKDKKIFSIYQNLYIGRNSSEIEYGKIVEKSLEIEKLYEENRFIYINAKGFENVILRVVSFDESQIVLVWKDAERNRIYNIFIKP